MAAGDYEAALPVALDAVHQGQCLFKPSPALQLFPLYLLAAQVSRPSRAYCRACCWLGHGTTLCCLLLRRQQAAPFSFDSAAVLCAIAAAGSLLAPQARPPVSSQIPPESGCRHLAFHVCCPLSCGTLNAL